MPVLKNIISLFNSKMLTLEILNVENNKLVINFFIPISLLFNLNSKQKKQPLFSNCF
ncbi:hypothetical protein EMELA_v1c02100 [Mesoplasma melaleucae]|uniref:Uncharacterized protein n=1 Tax=Mesoplasma melaleucae TaxID=81459 RepID=A0A2K8NYR4_9MOLU|nr:hypothetical protein EMELA_v1c02100 [Mesoplasma melaleucae]